MKRIVLVACSVLLIVPLYWMIEGSFQDIQMIMRIPPTWFPVRPTLANYIPYVTAVDAPRWFRNSAFVVSGSMLLNLACLLMASYAFSLYEFPGKRVLYWVYVASIMIPAQSLLIPRFVLMRHLHLIDTWWSLLLPGGFSAVYIVFLKAYMDHIPMEYVQAARLDGASELHIITHIMLPMTRPIIGYILVTGAIGGLQDYLWPSLMMSTPDRQTYAVGITTYIERWTTTLEGSIVPNYGIGLAGGVLMMLPILLIFLAFQGQFRKQFIQGGLRA